MGFTFYQLEMLPGLPSKMTIGQHDITVGQLLNGFAEKYGEQVLKNVIRDGKIGDEVMIALDGTIIRAWENPLDKVIPEGSELLLSMILAGG
jgi:hypothetical protein